MTIVCGDSHTATHGAFGALAFGIGTSEVEHVLATQTLLQDKPKTMELRVDGQLGRGVTAKDMILYLIGQITTDGGTGLRHRIHRQRDSFAVDGRADDRLQHVDRSRRRAGMIAPDAKTFDYLRGREFAPQGPDFDAAVAHWSQLLTDAGAKYDKLQIFQAAEIAPQVTWGTNPGQVTGVGSRVPDPASIVDESDRKTAARAWSTWI